MTVFGSLIDPIADKLTIVSGLLMANQAGLLTIWVSVIIFSREFMVDGVRLIASGQKCKVISASLLGKIKTASQFIGLILLFIAASGTNFVTDYMLWVGQYIMYFSTVIAVWGMFDYVSKNWDILRDSLKEK
ncbi:MAG: hypothetical protein PHS06_02880 [Candidatus Shapirobacteria bacterium]|nr:hypothetical protein [Candidatus Shapirobacteria bacterium]